MSVRQSQCLGKFRFETFGEADRVAKAARRRRYSQRQNAYRCGLCGGFHVGSNTFTASERKKIRRMEVAGG